MAPPCLCHGVAQEFEHHTERNFLQRSVELHTMLHATPLPCIFFETSRLVDIPDMSTRWVLLSWDITYVSNSVAR